MKRVKFLRFSQAVIAGLEIRGITHEGLELLVSIPKSRMARLRAGKADLSERETGMIEELTALTAGQLAALASEPNGGPYTELTKSFGRLLKLERAMRAEEVIERRLIRQGRLDEPLLDTAGKSRRVGKRPKSRRSVAAA